MKTISVVPVILGLLLISSPVIAVNTTQPLTVNMALSARAKLTLGVSAINFSDQDPDTAPSVAATEGAVAVTAKVRTGASSLATLTHRASGDLSAGAGVLIPVGNVSWTATGAGFVAGAMSSTSDVTAASWTGSNSYPGTFTYSILNKWTYATGSYTVTTTYTLTAP